MIVCTIYITYIQKLEGFLIFLKPPETQFYYSLRFPDPQMFSMLHTTRQSIPPNPRFHE